MNLPQLTFYDFAGVFTPAALVALAVASLIADIYLPRAYVRWVGRFALVGTLLILVLQAILHVDRLNWGQEVHLGFSDLFAFDGISVFFNYLFLIAALLTIGMSIPHLEGKEYHRGEYYVLILLAAAGMCLMAGAMDLVILFLGLETMSIAIYVLAGLDRQNPKSNEAALKYLLLGAFATGFLLFGIALLYGVTGSTHYLFLKDHLASIIENPDPRRIILFAGVGLVLVGFAFKVAAAPFHMWAPDVYEGAPTPITGFMATGVKAAAFAALLRLFLVAFFGEWMLTYNVLYVLAVLTMTVGNLVALSQQNLKRLLAYSSIAHAGYLLVGITALVASPDGPSAYNVSHAILYYLLAYLFMNLGAFAVIVAMGRDRRGGDYLDDYAGLSRSRPDLAGLMTIFLLSMTGVPPLAGFLGKFYLFQAAVHNRLYILVVIAVLNSVVSAYYYLRVIVLMYMQPEPARLKPALFDRNPTLSLVSLVAAAMTIILGIFPSRFLAIVFRAFQQVI